VARDPGGRVVAFCQFTPAPGIDGYSLDVMRRRADPDLPNGVIDVVVIETIFHLREQGRQGLALNFAVLREIVCGERETMLAALNRRVLLRFSETMQIESLRRYSEKFRPTWRPRYAVLESFEHLPVQSVAMADAESIWELPVIGRLLKPDAGTARLPRPSRRHRPERELEPVGGGSS
jgi:lysyl-tRNA synthetase class 2